MNIFNIFLKRKVLGIDIGTDAIKVVEVSRWGNRRKLENYCEVKSNFVSKEPLLDTNESGSLIASNVISSALRAMLKEAGIRTKKVVFSLPDFLTLAASFEIPLMPEKEIQGAVYYNASRYLTLPIEDVTLDWKIVAQKQADKNSAIKIFLIAVPNQVIKEYQKIARDSGLELHALESEVFGLVRSLVGGDKATILLVDMGAKTSTLNIVDQGLLKRSYSFNFSGSQLSTALASGLGVQANEAEKIKMQEGILSKRADVVKTLKNFISQLFSEIKSVSADFLTQEQQQISKFYLTGGSAHMPGLKDYFSENFQKPMYIPNAFSNIICPRALSNNLLEMSPRFSVAIGVASGMLDV